MASCNVVKSLACLAQAALSPTGAVVVVGVGMVVAADLAFIAYRICRFLCRVLFWPMCALLIVFLALLVRAVTSGS